ATEPAHHARARTALRQSIRPACSRRRTLRDRRLRSTQMDDVIRQRLRAAIKRTGRKHSDIAWQASVSPLTLSRVLNEPACNPYFSTILRLARAIDEPLGALVGEPAPL